MKTTPIDHGTKHRAQQQGGLRIGARIQTEAGIVLHRGAAARIECVLDALRETGLLNGAEGTKVDRVAVGRSRYEQWLWLRGLFMRAGLNGVHAMDHSSKTGSAPTTAAASNSGITAISDEAARARMKFSRVVKELGPFADDVTAFACFDKIRRGDQHLAFLRKGLDKLCEMRG